jgi:hypothetical protein
MNIQMTGLHFVSVSVSEVYNEALASGSNKLQARMQNDTTNSSFGTFF